ncbi:TULIP family P47-like protein [Brevibacterium sp. JNUCC-42]|nr:TULIP family P47-like protein [Brevibacterium sp. JNUCC-42]
MKKKNIDSLRIYDWTKTIEDVKNRDSKMLRNVPSSFYQEMKDSSMSAKVQGNWGNWELTDEGSGQYPIYKCYIENGTFEVDTNNEKTTHHLQNSWIKICLKIEESQTEMYVISEKEDTLYSINHSFHIDNSNRMASILLEKLLVTWFKEHRHLLHQQINTYNIQYSDISDLSLMGWDTSYVTSFSNVNKIIQQKKLYPQHFLTDFHDLFFGDFGLNGTFESWEIATGADGQNVNFVCKISEDGYFSFETPLTSGSYPLQGELVKIQLKLKYFNSEKTITDSTGKGNGDQFDLKVKTDNNEDKPVIIVSTPGVNQLVLDAMIKTMFEEWFNANIDQFENIFSHLLLGETAKDENFQWLKPTDKYYGVAEGTDGTGKPSLDHSVFAVMTMVENRKNNYPSHTVDARLLHAVKNAKATNDSAFGIDMPLFVDKWLVRGLGLMQVGTPDEFEKIPNGVGIQNKERIQFGNVEDHSGNPVPSYIDPKKFKLSIVNNQLDLDIENLNWEHQSGLIAHINYRQQYSFSLKSGVDELGKEYKNVLVPTEVNDATISFAYTIEEWRKWSTFAIDMTVGFALSVGTGMIFSSTSSTFVAARQTIKNLIIEGAQVATFRMTMKQFLSNLGLALSKEMRKLVARRASVNLEMNVIRNGVYLPTTEALHAIRTSLVPAWSRIWEVSYKAVLLGIQFGLIGLAGMTPALIAGYLEASAQEHFSELPTIDAFLANCVGAVNWPDNSEFQVETAQLQGIYLMGGKLTK